MRTFRLALRLAAGGGREPLLRHAVTAVGVGIGVLLLLLALTVQAAVGGRADRSGWISADETTELVAEDAALFLSVDDYHDGEVMTRAYVAALGPNPPVPPGLERLPGPGEVAASPAMQRLFEATPDDQLDDRYPGRVTATIGDAGLAHPDALVAIVGRTPEQLADVRSDELETVRGFDSRLSGYAFFLVVRALLLQGAVLLLVPVVAFIVMATRVASAQREQRLAAIRLVGATRAQAAIIGATETGTAALAGSVAGWASYEVGRRLLAATVTFQGAPFHADDVAVPPRLLLVVLGAVPVLAVVTTLAALARTRLTTPDTGTLARRPLPTARRALPLALGLGGLLAAAPLRRVVEPDTVDDLAAMFTVVTIVGLVAIGPWLCLLAGRAVARFTRRAPGLIAARRIAGDPSATFRAVSGVVLAAFAVTYAAGLVDPAHDELDERASTLPPGVVEVGTAGVPMDTVAPLLSRPNIDAPVDAATGLVGSLRIPTDGTTAAENRVRTEAANLVPNAIIHTRQDLVNREARFFASVGQLLSLFWYGVLVVAACSLTVGMVAGLVERRRPFALLRASGLQLAELRRVVFLETAATMLATATMGVVLGLGASYATARFGELNWAWPGPAAFAAVGVGILAALLLAATTLPLLNAATRHDAVRYE